MIVVPSLTVAEMLVCAQVGVSRQIRALQRGATDRAVGRGGDPWGINVEGAAAEYVVANWLHSWWNAITPLDAFPYDVAPNVQVRWTPRADGGLILRPADPPDGKFVLVTGRMPDYRIVGSLTAHRGMRPAYRRDEWDAWCVPQTDLEDWTT